MLSTDNFTNFSVSNPFLSTRKKREFWRFFRRQKYFLQNLCSGHPVSQFVIFLNFPAFPYWLTYFCCNFSRVLIWPLSCRKIWAEILDPCIITKKTCLYQPWPRFHVLLSFWAVKRVICYEEGVGKPTFDLLKITALVIYVCLWKCYSDTSWEPSLLVLYLSIDELENLLNLLQNKY